MGSDSCYNPRSLTTPACLGAAGTSALSLATPQSHHNYMEPSPHELTLRTCAVSPLHSLTWTTTTPATCRQNDWHILPSKSGKRYQKLPLGLLTPSALCCDDTSNYTQRLIYGDWSFGLKLRDSQTSGHLLSDECTARKILEATEYKLHFLTHGYSANNMHFG